MKKSYRFIAMLMTIITIISTLTSCNILGSIANGSTGDSQIGNDPNHEHFYVNGKCACSAIDPDYTGPHNHVFVEGVCSCGKIDYSYEKPHSHEYVNGVCSCGQVNPNYEEQHTHSFIDGKCNCGEIDPSWVEPHKHSFTDGMCSCGYADPSYVPPHYCESICETCGGCLDSGCNENACATKCAGHIDPNIARYGYLPIISEVMPEIHINTEDGSNVWATKYSRSDKLAGRIDYVNATVSTFMCDDEFIITDLEAQVKVRGNYTLDYAKKPIRIKFKSKTNMLGLHDGEKYKNWVLLADWKDLSMTNNTLAYYLGNTILGSDGYYCTDFRNVEVYLNGVYWGVYLLAEQQEVKDGRTSASEVEDGYTGVDIGYFFEYDGYYNLEGENGDPTFTINHQGLPASSGGYTVKSDINSDEQLQFLKNYVENVLYIARQATKGSYYQFDENYKVIAAPSSTNSKEIIGSVIDLQSLVDIYILNELAKDLDVDWSSFYMSLDMSESGSKKIIFEAPWDFDSSFGLTHKDNCAPTEGLYAMSNANPWFRLVENQDWFWDMVYEKWAELKKYGVLDNALKLIETQKETYKEYYIKNYTKWSQRVTNGNSECVSILNTYKDIDTAQGLAADYTYQWLKARIVWLDSQWSNVVNEGDIIESSEKYLFEAEFAALGNFTASQPIRTNKDYASGSSYVGNVAVGTTITFTVTCEEDTTVLIYAGIAKRTSTRNFSSMFTLTVNGEEIVVPARTLPAISDGEEDWHCFISLKLTAVQLTAGENIITFTTIADATNFDYIEIYSPVPLF